MQFQENITVSVTVACSVKQAWDAFTTPSAVMKWNFASPDWHCPAAKNDLRVGGKFCYRMEAKDGSMGFDYEGIFLELTPQRHMVLALGIELGANRQVVVQFTPTADDKATMVSQTFTPENVFPPEQQRQGWQAIMDNYARHVAVVYKTA